MRPLHQFPGLSIVLAAMVVAGCANPTRSRNLGDPSVPAVVIAQQVCSACHGVTGASASPNFPNLAAQRPAYLAAQLQEFRSAGRSDPAGFEYMWGLSRGLTDAQIQGLADYYAGQAAARGIPVRGTVAARVAAGETLFRRGVEGKPVPPCAGCHGEHAQGNDAFPRLAGQHADYVVKQLAVFQRGDERPRAAVMKVIAHELSPQDIDDVAAYLASL